MLDGIPFILHIEPSSLYLNRITLKLIEQQTQLI